MGSPMRLDKLGNFTYGFLGYAYDIPLEMLIGGSYYAAGFPSGGGLLLEEFEDWEYIYWGYLNAEEYYNG